ncbi:9720_t:CDS:1, partial [Dentiscutata heterogama]
YHTKILSADANSDLQNSFKNFYQITDPILNNIIDVLRALNLPDPIQIKEYLAIPEKNIVYKILSNDYVITELVKIF